MFTIPLESALGMVALIIINHILTCRQYRADHNPRDEAVPVRQINIILIRTVLIIIFVVLFWLHPFDGWLILLIIYYSFHLLLAIFLYQCIQEDRQDLGGEE